MTIREAGKGVVVGDTGAQTYRIGFNGNDETELDAKNMSELEELWRSLCPEFRCKANSVDYVERVVGNELSVKKLNKEPEFTGRIVTALAERGAIYPSMNIRCMWRECCPGRSQMRKSNPFWINCMRNGVKC